MKKNLLSIALGLVAWSASAQCPNFKLTIMEPGRPVIVTSAGDNVTTSYTFCPKQGTLTIGASGYPYASHPTFTWSNGVQGHAVYMGLQGMTDNLTLNEGLNNISVRTWVCGTGAGSCGCEQTIAIFVCSSTVGLSEQGIEGSRIKREAYFDMQGREVAHPENGIFVRRVFYENGNVKSSKVLR